MDAVNKRPKGYNIFQARIYSLTDELDLKHTFMDFNKAERLIMGCFTDEHYGPLYSHATIRSLDPILRGWVVPHAMNNPNAILFDPAERDAEEWKITIYDLGDRIINTLQLAEMIAEKELELLMLTQNAFYSVISAREHGEPEHRFLVSEIRLNSHFNLHVEGANKRLAKSRIPSGGENLALTYAKALAEDEAETARIRERQAHREQND